MDVMKLFTFISLLLINNVDFGLSACTRPSATSGTITNYKYEKRYLECWEIIVPPNEYVELNMTSFSSILGCFYTNVEISIANQNYSFIICTNQRKNWGPFKAYSNVVVTHKINASEDIFSMFSMEYRRENILCAQENTFRCNNGLCIPRSKVCDGLNHCNEGDDEKGCKNSLCGQKNIFKCNDTVCIPSFQICDGIKHCYDGRDEKGCEPAVFAVPGIATSRLNGTRLLKRKWSPSSGWQENTHRGIIALHLATKRNGTDVDIVESLLIKQLEVQALESLLRDGTDSLTSNQLSMFVNALIVSCQDPRDFHGFDLPQLLREKAEASFKATRPVAYLALCNAGETLQANETSDISNILNRDWQHPFFIEVQAVALMALSCVWSNQQDGFNSSTLHTDYDQAVKKLKQLQLDDGSFGNIYTTAIVTQALLSAGQESSRDWKFNAAVHHLMRHLNSSSVDFLAAYLILPVLNGRSLSDIRNTNCSFDLKNKSQGDSVPDVKNKLFKITVKYSLYIGDDKETIYTISLRAPESITVFEIMQLAEEADPKFKFKWKKMVQKLYVYEIAGIINDFEDGLLWVLHARKNSTGLVVIPQSPDTVILDDGAHIIMWYRKIRA